MPVAASAPTSGFPYTLREVAPGITVALAAGGGRAGANATIIDLGNRTLVVDAGMTRAVGARLCEAAQDATGRPPTWLAVTHGHSDHLWGAAGFPDATELIATTGTQQLLAAAAGHEGAWYRNTAPAELARIDRQLADATLNAARRQQLEAGREFYAGALGELAHLQLRRPTLTFDRRLVLHGSHRRVELVTHGGGHTRSDAVAWVPDVGLLIAGDLVTVQAHPWLGGGDVLEWLRILETLQTLGAQIVVPGHGPVAGGDACEAMGEYLRCILEMAEGVALHEEPDVDADPESPAPTPPTPEETAAWARGVPMPEAWSDWAFSSFFAHNLQHLAGRLFDQPST